MMMYNEEQAAALLTCISKNLNLLQSQKFPINLSYFRGRVHRLWFILLTKLYLQGKVKADIPDLMGEAETEERYEKIVVEEELHDYWNIMLEDVSYDIDNYEGYYNIVNIWALLRTLNEKGYSIAKFYDEENDCLTACAQGMKAKEIIEEYTSEISGMRTTYDNNFCRSEVLAGNHTAELLEMFKLNPATGMPFPSSALTELTNGLKPGTLHCISASSGAGKTVYAVSTICKNCVSEYWSFAEGKFVSNPNYNSSNGHTLYTHCEMDGYSEVNVRFLACISGVNARKISTGSFNKAEEKRILHAGEVLAASGIHIVSMPNFTPSMLREKVKEINHKFGITLYVHDYVELTPALSAYYQDDKQIQRPDQMILAVMTELKELAEEMNIAILTFTQTNMTEDQLDFPDASCIAGAKATQNKLDSGCIMLPCSRRIKDTNKARKAFAESKKNGFSTEETFSTVIYLYKARSGQWGGERIKIFSSVDYGTCRQIDLLAMTHNDSVFNAFDINKHDLKGWAILKGTPQEDL